VTGVAAAAETMTRLAGEGIDMDDVGRALERQGIAASTTRFATCSPRWASKPTVGGCLTWTGPAGGCFGVIAITGLTAIMNADLAGSRSTVQV